ncbi:MAG: NAD-dependent epimerase/dehydratase family protein [bacterium]
MKILITGGAGFVGSNLSIKLKEKYPDYTIVAFDNLKRRGSELNLERFKKAGIDFIHGDIRNKEDFEILSTYDLMIECSAEPSVLAGVNSSPSYLLNTNLVGTINCLESVRNNNAKIIFISTSRVYPIEKINNLNIKELETRFILENKQNLEGISEKGIAENFTLEGARTLYGATKLSSELLVQEYMYTYEIESIINRCGVISGPWQMGKVDQGFIVLWIAKHIFGGNLSYIGYNGSGKQVRDFIHIDDLFNIIDIQINDFKKYSGQIFNIGGGVKNSISLLELTNLCEKITNNKVNISRVVETRPGDLKIYITDSSKIQNLTNWTPKKDIETTIKDIYDWIQNNKDALKNILS